jgi:hypothetical protein
VSASKPIMFVIGEPGPDDNQAAADPVVRTRLSALFESLYIHIPACTTCMPLLRAQGPKAFKTPCDDYAALVLEIKKLSGVGKGAS